MHDKHDIIDKRYPQFSVILQILLLFYEKGFQKTKFKIYITDSFPRYRCMLFFGAFEDRKTLTNRVVFFSRNQS